MFEPAIDKSSNRSKPSTQEIRDLFLNYFREHQHTIVPSSSLIPGNDKTLLFVNAGMVQFKDTFLGIEQRPYARATSSQRCVRAGGKHNDLDNVGHTKRHHTFFEMLGNFSFGDYFKREAIQFAWAFLTQVLKLPAERLWVTVYRDDPESEAIWLKEMKIDPKRFSRCGEKDNFWSMGDTGPCGPCTEIFYDHGPDVEGGPPGSPDEEGDRYVEIWNLVFMQYNRDKAGQLDPLPKQSVDTGMGLERIAAVMQGVHDNYEIDLFQFLLKKLADLLDYHNLTHSAMRVIVDHIRSTAFLIVDGVVPSNEGRGYVLRRIIRRALRYGYLLGQKDVFFYQLTDALAEIMGDAYPELIQSQQRIKNIIEQEERQFANTLEKGLKLLDQEMSKLKSKQLPGGLVFQLYDTYGFPPDLTRDIAHERGFTLDEAGFEQAMAVQRSQSQQQQRFKISQAEKLDLPASANQATEFLGYQSGQIDAQPECEIIAILDHQNQALNQIIQQDTGALPATLILNRTPFYAESGGQVGDQGHLRCGDNVFHVKDTQKYGQVILHQGEMQQGILTVGDTVTAQVSSDERIATMLNHSATHLLHQALRDVLGEHVVQKGSLVEPKRLRFDFTHQSALTVAELQAVELSVNQAIRDNLATRVQVCSVDEAKSAGALALFGEKYDPEIRVVSMGDYSKEICGGTHVEHSGEIGLFKITQETASASGIRRIEAVTGEAALRWVNSEERILDELAGLLKVDTHKLPERVSQLLAQQKLLNKQVEKLQKRSASESIDTYKAKAKNIHGINLVAVEVTVTNRDAMRELLDQLKQQLEPAAIVLGSIAEGKVQLVAGVSKSCTDKITAPVLLKQVAEPLGGRGGGRPEFAQGGGENPKQLKSALQSVYGWLEKQL